VRLRRGRPRLRGASTSSSDQRCMSSEQGNPYWRNVGEGDPNRAISVVDDGLVWLSAGEGGLLDAHSAETSVVGNASWEFPMSPNGVIFNGYQSPMVVGMLSGLVRVMGWYEEALGYSVKSSAQGKLWLVGE
jgi:hypothetical protein